MKISELINDFSVFMSNEEQEVLSKTKEIRTLESFTQREQFIIENLIKKALVSKIHRNGTILVLANDLR